MVMNDAEYLEFMAKVRAHGHISHLTHRINFMAYTDDSTHDWLEIKWGEGVMRLDIYDDKIHINCYPLVLHEDASNAITITRRR